MTPGADVAAELAVPLRRLGLPLRRQTLAVDFSLGPQGEVYIYNVAVRALEAPERRTDANRVQDR